jgi:hypothetical protein
VCYILQAKSKLIKKNGRFCFMMLNASHASMLAKSFCVRFDNGDGTPVAAWMTCGGGGGWGGRGGGGAKPEQENPEATARRLLAFLQEWWHGEHSNDDAIQLFCQEARALDGIRRSPAVTDRVVKFGVKTTDQIPLLACDRPAPADRWDRFVLVLEASAFPKKRWQLTTCNDFSAPVLLRPSLLEKALATQAGTICSPPPALDGGGT